MRKLDRFISIAVIIGTGAMVAIIAAFARLSFLLALAVRDTSPTCGVDECYADVRILWLILTLLGAFVSSLYAVGVVTALVASGWWRLLGVAALVPVVLVALLAVELVFFSPLGP